MFAWATTAACILLYAMNLREERCTTMLLVRGMERHKLRQCRLKHGAKLDFCGFLLKAVAQQHLLLLLLLLLLRCARTHTHTYAHTIRKRLAEIWAHPPFMCRLVFSFLFVQVFTAKAAGSDKPQDHKLQHMSWVVSKLTMHTWTVALPIKCPFKCCIGTDVCTSTDSES